MARRWAARLDDRVRAALRPAKGDELRVDGVPIIGYRRGDMSPNAAFSSSPHPDQEKQVMAAWDRFLRGAELPSNAVRSVIEGSWSRCLSAGVDPGRSRAHAPVQVEELGTLQHPHRDLIDASVPVMQQARDFLSESGTMMILTDPTGVILETEGDPATLDAAQDVRLVGGANWDELACGTNAIGTALSVRQL